jgi:hypothetical protein
VFSFLKTRIQPASTTQPDLSPSSDTMAQATATLETVIRALAIELDASASVHAASAEALLIAGKAKAAQIAKRAEQRARQAAEGWL